MRLIYLCIAALLFIAGCADGKTNEGRQQVATEEEKRGELTKQLRVNERTDTKREYAPENIEQQNIQEQLVKENPGSYTNKRTIEITKRVMERRDVRNAQVAMTKDRVLVALMLENKIDTRVKDEVKDLVEKMEPDKEVVVLTDDIYWSKKRDRQEIR